MENKPRVGDFVVGEDTLWEITNIYEFSTLVGDMQETVYDIECVNKPSDALEIYDWSEEKYVKAEFDNNLKAITYAYLTKLGRIVPKEEASKAIETLFKS